MSKTTTTKPVFRMGTDELLATATERTVKGNHTAAANRARKEIERRDAKRAAKTTPVAVATQVEATVELDLAALLAQARKAALALATQAAKDLHAGNKPGFVKTNIRLRRAAGEAFDAANAA